MSGRVLSFEQMSLRMDIQRGASYFWRSRKREEPPICLHRLDTDVYAYLDHLREVGYVI